jgi:hypothetical protein
MGPSIRTIGVGDAIIGGAFYNGAAYGPLNGAYIFGDTFGVIYMLQTDASDHLISARPQGRLVHGPGNTDNEPPNGVGIRWRSTPAPTATPDRRPQCLKDLRAQGLLNGCPPVARHVNPIGGKANQTVFTFDGSQSHDPGWEPAQLHLDFGDSTGTGAVVQHVYTTDRLHRSPDGERRKPVRHRRRAHHHRYPPTIRLVPDKQGRTR